MKPVLAPYGPAPTLALTLALPLALAGCVPQPRSAPAPQARPAPVAMPAPLPPPVHSNWMDAPATAGDWTYRTGLGGGVAQFASSGVPIFNMKCEAAARTVILTRMGAAFGSEQMTVRSESQSRTLPAVAVNGDVSSRLGASDRLLDAMALSKGRFAIEVPSAPTLYLPSWAEVTRVIEDCR